MRNLFLSAFILLTPIHVLFADGDSDLKNYKKTEVELIKAFQEKTASSRLHFKFSIGASICASLLAGLGIGSSALGMPIPILSEAYVIGGLAGITFVGFLAGPNMVDSMILGMKEGFFQYDDRKSNLRFMNWLVDMNDKSKTTQNWFRGQLVYRRYLKEYKKNPQTRKLTYLEFQEEAKRFVQNGGFSVDDMKNFGRYIFNTPENAFLRDL